jgi:hypothetical protein
MSRYNDGLARIVEMDFYGPRGRTPREPPVEPGRLAKAADDQPAGLAEFGAEIRAGLEALAQSIKELAARPVVVEAPRRPNVRMKVNPTLKTRPR